MATKHLPLLVAPELTGRAYAQAHAAATDQWFAAVAHQNLAAIDSEVAGQSETRRRATGEATLDHMALLAVGGYGRGELCPRSDIDLILVLADEANANEVAEALWYPAWDRGLDIGYSVVTLGQAEILLANEFEWATALLDTRLIVGNPALHSAIDELTAELWRSERDRLMNTLFESVEERHLERGDAASFIEPNLKEGRGGLRDVHAMGWASRATPGFANEFLAELGDEVDTLLDARVELHRHSNRRGDVLHLDSQDAVAKALGERDTDAYMHRLSVAARRIAWCSQEAWSRWTRARRAAAPTPTAVVPPEPGTRPATPKPRGFDGPLLAVGNGLLAIRSDAPVGSDPLLLLQLASGAAHNDLIMSRDSLSWLARDGAEFPDPWPAEARELFAKLFEAGRPAIAVVEDLDQFGLMRRLIPEWEHVHCRPQRNVFHTFTVDRHLCEAAVNAATILQNPDRGPLINRPDLLVVGTLLHDIGKGYPGDHTEVGVRIIGTIGERMGYPADEVGVLVDLCRHHLLLPDVATRRDLADPSTIKAVAAAVDSVEFLRLLAALTESDSAATGPAAWNGWKAQMLAELVARTEFVLNGGELAAVAVDDFPTEEVRAIMAQGRQWIHGHHTTFTVVTPDHNGLFSALAGVLAVCGLDVLDANSHTEIVSIGGTDKAIAAVQFELQPPTTGSVDWERVSTMAAAALAGRVSLRSRVERRAAEHRRYRRKLSAEPPRRRILIDNESSELATVIEVHAPDEVGLLYSLTQVMGELRFDIQRTKIQTLGPQVVDSFYVVDRDGTKITDPDLLSELDLGLNQVIGGS